MIKNDVKELQKILDYDLKHSTYSQLKEIYKENLSIKESKNMGKINYYINIDCKKFLDIENPPLINATCTLNKINPPSGGFILFNTGIVCIYIILQCF